MPDSQFRFHFDRSLQAAAHLLKQADGQAMKYIHLLKLLYIADREYLAERGYPITGDRVLAMQYGPVLSNVYGLIKGEADQAEQWHQFIQTLPKSRQVRLIEDPGVGDLSRASMSKLDDVFKLYGNMKPFRVVQLTHDYLEWQKHYRGCVTTIPWWSILRAQGAEEMQPFVEDQIRLQRHQEALQKVCQ